MSVERLTDEEIASIERSLGGPSSVAVSKSETCRMLRELQQCRARAALTEQRVLEVVGRLALDEIESYPIHRDHRKPLAWDIAARVAKELAGAAVDRRYVNDGDGGCLSCGQPYTYHDAIAGSDPPAFRCRPARAVIADRGSGAPAGHTELLRQLRSELVLLVSQAEDRAIELRSESSRARWQGLPQRGIRLLEEAIEAAQAVGCEPEQAHKLVDYVFSRPVGDLHQELGGVSVCLLALAAAAGLSADEEEQREVDRVLSKPIAEFTKRNQAKNDAGFLACKPSSGEV